VNILFIELYLDEDVNVLVAALLRARGFTALTARQAGQLHNSDARQLAYAVNQRKTFLTHNRTDFEALDKEYLAARQTDYSLWQGMSGTILGGSCRARQQSQRPWTRSSSRLLPCGVAGDFIYVSGTLGTKPESRVAPSQKRPRPCATWPSSYRHAALLLPTSSRSMCFWPTCRPLRK
jgi:Domain of unknown function (DUF5615)